MKRWRCRKVLLLALLCLVSLARAEALDFALFGDTPYSDYERNQLPLILQAMGEANLAFAIHDGDIKNGHSLCSDDMYQDIRRVFDAAPLPVVYVPGDNEWTDCQRKACGGYDQQERLTYLRKTFFPDQRSLGQRRIDLLRQKDWPENVRWEAGGVLFVSLNIPGDDNNVKHKEDFATRGQANRTWLAEAFRIAGEKRLPGILIDIQANPFIEADNEGVTKPGFREFLDQLRVATAAFPGQVVLVHGDTHSVRIDKPLRDRESHKPVSNFTRVETFGAPFMGWVKGTVDPQDPAVFRFEQRPWRPNSTLGSPGG